MAGPRAGEVAVRQTNCITRNYISRIMRYNTKGELKNDYTFNQEMIREETA
jgi:hypothetical protein